MSTLCGRVKMMTKISAFSARLRLFVFDSWTFIEPRCVLTVIAFFRTPSLTSQATILLQVTLKGLLLLEYTITSLYISDVLSLGHLNCLVPCDGPNDPTLHSIFFAFDCHITLPVVCSITSMKETVRETARSRVKSFVDEELLQGGNVRDYGQDTLGSCSRGGWKSSCFTFCSRQRRPPKS